MLGQQNIGLHLTRLAYFAFAAVLFYLSGGGSALAQGNAGDGARVFQSQCSVCHSERPAGEPLEARHDLFDCLLRCIRFMIGHRVTSLSPIPASHDAWCG